MRFRAWRPSSGTGPNARLSDHPRPLAGSERSVSILRPGHCRRIPRETATRRARSRTADVRRLAGDQPGTRLTRVSGYSRAARRRPAVRRDRSGDVRLRSALRRGLQLLERALPALPDVARGERRRQLAEALETDVVLHPQGGADRSRAQARPRARSGSRRSRGRGCPRSAAAARPPLPRCRPDARSARRRQKHARSGPGGRSPHPGARRAGPRRSTTRPPPWAHA
jgi:hypothetical protein